MLKRVLAVLVIVLAVTGVALFVVRDRVATELVDRVLARVTAQAAARGVVVRDARFSSVEWVGWRSLAIRGFSCRASFRQGALGAQSVALTFERIVVAAVDVASGVAGVEVSGGVVDRLDSAGGSTGERVSELRAEMRMPFSWVRRAETFAALEREARQLMKDGRTTVAFRLSGLARFRAGARWHTVSILARPDGAGSRLLFLRDDVVRLGRTYTRELTGMEIDIVTENPTRAPVLLALTEKASDKADELARREPGFPKDAFRHVYWSFLLTREYGPEFARSVTDAHETAATYERAESDRRMDLANNAVGRGYAIAGVPEQELPARVRTDPKIVRRAR